MAEIQEEGTDIEAQSVMSTEEDHGTTKFNGEHVAVSIDELRISMKKRLDELSSRPLQERSVTIFRLPCSIHEITKKTLCEPQMVAIGPYHHNKENLRTVEERKWYSFRNFLARNKNVDLEDYLQAMRSIEVKARNCYSESVNMESNDFLRMLLLDGCFILEYLASRERCPNVICDSAWASEEIFTDMCLFENQVPFFVLRKLWAIQNRGVTGRPNCEKGCPLLKDLCPVLKGVFQIITPFREPQESCDDIHHLLHLCYLGVVPAADHKPQTQCQKKKFNRRLGSFVRSKLYSKSGKAASSKQSDFAPTDPHYSIPSISELHDAGVKFTRKKNPASMFDLSFTNGTFEMPFLCIQSPTIRILWNMVAFEQSRIFWGLPQTLSSYLGLMDTLIDTGKDVAILEQSGIFESYFQNAEEAATYFNQFDEIFGLDYREHYFKGLFQDVRKYTKSVWPRYRARLMQDYFSNPWSIISVVAAGILLILTVVQTYYSAAK